MHKPSLLRIGFVTGLVLAGLVTAASLANVAFWLSDLLAQFLIQATVVAALITVTAAATRHWVCAVCGTVVVGLAAVPLAGEWPGSLARDAEAAPPQTFTALVANVWGRNRQSEALVERIRDLDADLMFLLEVHRRHHPALEVFASSHPTRLDCEARSCDVLLLTRFPTAGSAIDKVDPKTGASVNATDLLVGDRRLRAVGTHLTRPIVEGSLGRQLAQVDFIIDRAAIDQATIVGGDFNAVPWGQVVKRFEARSGVLATAGGLTGTWPSWLPLPLRLPIDQVFVGSDLMILSRHVVDLPGSDHEGVLVEVAFRS